MTAASQIMTDPPVADSGAIGVHVGQVNAREKVTGRAVYVGDMHLPGMLHVKVLRSPYAHALIKRIDTSAAKNLPGVHAVLTGEDTPEIETGLEYKEHRILASRKVRFIGEEVAAVAAISEDVAQDALDLIRVEYDELPGLFTAEEALSCETSVHDGRRQGDRNNVASDIVVTRGDVDRAFEDAAIVYEAEYDVHAQYHGYLEPMGAVAEMSPDGRLTVWAPTQNLHFVRARFAEALGMRTSSIRVIQTMIGGAFGGKGAFEEPCTLIAAFVATRVKRPVRYVHTRIDDFLTTRAHMPQRLWLKMGVDKDGILVGKDIRIVGECGAYAGTSRIVLKNSLIRADNAYRLKNSRAAGVLVYTNNPPRGAFRGMGAQQGAFAVNAHMDVLAEKLGIDPLELHRRNASQVGDTTIHGWELASCGLTQCIEEVGRASGWDGKFRQQKPEEGAAVRRGVGFALATHSTGSRSLGDWNGASVILRLEDDGRVTLITSESDMGQGAHTVLAQICARELKVPIGHVKVVNPDTDSAPFGFGTFGSRVTLVTGEAVIRAAAQAMAKLKAIAAQKLGVAEGELEASNGEIYVRSSNPNQKLTYEELVRMHLLRPDGEGITVIGSFDGPSVMADANSYGNVALSYTFSAQVAEVEVDTKTGKVTLVSTHVADDCGRALNPTAVHGQTVGGAAQAIGWTLYEHLQYQDGGLLNGEFADYVMPTADALPDIHSIIVESIDPNGPYGAKGSSETAIGPGAAAIANAVYDAIGVRIDSLPITPEKVLDGLRAKKNAEMGVVADA